MDQYNNTCHYSIDKKPVNADYSASTEKAIPKALRSKVNDRIRTFLVKVILKIGQSKYLFSILLRKLIPGLKKLKI